MAALLYFAVAAAALAAWNRWVTPLSRAAAIVVMLLPLLFTGKALLTNRVYGPFDLLFYSQPFADYAKEYGFTGAHSFLLIDNLTEMAPWQHQQRVSLARGEWPLWNPTMDSGEVLAAGLQVTPYNPINVLALLLPLDLSIGFTATMVFFLAALFAFACARELECSEGAALIAAAGYALSNAMAFHVGWPHARSWTVFPFLLLAVRRIVRAQNAAAFALLTFAFVLLIAFGHPETMLHSVTIAVLFGVFELIPVWRRSLRPIVMAIGSGILALLMTAVVLLPFVAVLGTTWEQMVRRALSREPWKVTTEHVWRAVRSTFIPYYGGATWHGVTPEWEMGTARVGSVIVVLAAIAMIRFWRRREARFLIVLCAVTLMAGWNARPVATALRSLPLFDMALNERLAFAAAFSFSLLAAMAFDAQASARRDRWIVIGAGAALAIATAWFWRVQLTAGVDPKFMIAGAAAELFGMAMVIAALSTSSRRVALALIIAAIAGQRVVEEGNTYPAVPRRMFFPTVPLVKAIPRDPMYRFVATQNLIIPNVGTIYGLEDIRGYVAMTYFPYLQTMRLWCPTATRVYHDVTDLSLPFLDFLGVRYAVTLRPNEPPDGWRIIKEDRSCRLIENTRAIPRVFVPRRIRFLKDEGESTIDEMLKATDFAETAWIDTRDATPHTIANGEAQLNVRRIGTRYEIDADARAGTHIVITECAWPGWRAYVDERRVKIESANHSFLGMYVPPGRHHLCVVYLPDAFVRGRAISIGTLLLVGVAVAWRRRRRPRLLATSLVLFWL